MKWYCSVNVCGVIMCIHELMLYSTNNKQIPCVAALVRVLTLLMFTETTKYSPCSSSLQVPPSPSSSPSNLSLWCFIFTVLLGNPRVLYEAREAPADRLPHYRCLGVSLTKAATFPSFHLNNDESDKRLQHVHTNTHIHTQTGPLLNLIRSIAGESCELCPLR